MHAPATLETVRRAVRGVVERTPELRDDAELRRRIAENMVRVCATAAGLMEEEDRLTGQIARRARSSADASPSPASASPASASPASASPASGTPTSAAPTDGSASPESRGGSATLGPGEATEVAATTTKSLPNGGKLQRPATDGSPVGSSAEGRAAVAAGMGVAAAGRPAGRRTMAAGQAAGDIHRRTAVNSAAGVLRATRDAIDFPGFVTSLISGVFQAMTTSTIQQLQAYADLLGAVGMSSGQFASSSITTGRAMDWVAQRFPAFRVVVAEGQPPRLEVNDDAEMPDEAELRSALDATDEEVSTIDDSELEETLVPLVKRKLARERQAMLSTMLLMGMNRIVVDDGRIRASMELQVDARSTAEQTTAERADTRVTTGGSASFGMGMWGASANMQATVGYVKSDEQFTREDIAVRAGLRSTVDIGFHTEPIALNRMATPRQRQQIQGQSMVPETEQALQNQLTADERRTTRPTFDALPQMQPQAAPAPNSDEARNLRRRQDHTVTDGAGAAPTATPTPTPTPAPTPAPTATPTPTPAPAPAEPPAPAGVE